MTLLTSSATSFVDGDPGSPSHFNSKFVPIYADISALSAVPSRAPYFNVKSYGAIGDGGTDDTAAIRSAMTAAVAAGTRAAAVYFPAGDYAVTSTITIPSGYGNLWFVGDGHYASLIRSSHSLIMFDVQSGGNNGWTHLGLVGSGYTYQGTRASLNVGIYVRAGSSAIYFVQGTMQSTGSYCVFFEATAGSQSLIADSILAPSFATTTSPRPEASIGQRGLDAGSVPRTLANIQTSGGRLFDVDGVNDLFACNCFAHNISMTSRSQNIFMQGVRLGTEGSTTTITGTTIELFGGGHAGAIVLDTNAINCTVIASTVSGITDLTSGGSNLILGGIYNNTTGGFRLAASRALMGLGANALLPSYAFSSESSLGLYRSEASVVALSYGALQTKGWRTNVSTVIGNTTLTVNDQAISVNSTSTTTQTLPAPSTVTGQVFVVKRFSTGTVVINATSGASLDNNSTMTLTSVMQALTFQSYGSGYIAV